MTPVVPKPAASVVLVREGAAAPVEVYMIRRARTMRFLGGYYAFPGGKVEPADASAECFTRCRGLDAVEAAALLAADCDVPPLAYWVAAARELLEESMVLLACDEAGTAIDPEAPGVAEAAERCRKDLLAGASFAAVLAREGWYADLATLRYLSHFVTPTASPIRFSARFFLCRPPASQAPRLCGGEATEGLWIEPGDGHRRFKAGEMAMAEPAEYALGYLAQFPSLDALVAAHADGQQKFQGIIERTDLFYR